MWIVYVYVQWHAGIVQHMKEAFESKSIMQKAMAGCWQKRDECIQLGACRRWEDAATVWALWCWSTLFVKPRIPYSSVSSCLNVLRLSCLGCDIKDLVTISQNRSAFAASLNSSWWRGRYDHVLKTSHAFNILDARGAIGVTERARYFGRMRT